MTMNRLTRLLEPVALGILLFGGLGLIISTFLGTADVVGTQMFGVPVPGATEITESTMVLIVFGALTYTQIRRSHIRVELLYMRAGARGQAAMDVFASLMAILFFSLLLWQATNPAARDFRLPVLGPAFNSTPVEADERGIYTARVPAPERGWSAWFLELTYDVGAPKPLKLTTEVVVTPDVLPFEDKPLNLPTSVTAVCPAVDGAAARAIGVAIVSAPKEELDTEKITTEVLGDRLFVNWTPSGDKRTSALAVGKFLEAEGCRNGHFQLESGEGMTLPPGR